MHIHELETPAVVVDLDVLERNLRQMAGYTEQHGLGLRPHTKTHKIPAIAQRQVELGSRGLTVAKVGEAEVMAEAGLDDLLVAYPVLGDSKLDRLARIARERRVMVAVDSPVTAEALSQAAQRAGATIHLLVEFDSGMRRCGVADPAEALALAQAIDRLPGVHLAGVTTYPGHIWAAPEEQASALNTVSETVEAVVTRLREGGFACEIVSAGSTPTAYQSHQVRGLTEIRPGTYVFNDRNTAGVGACSWDDCALRVIVTVISTAVPGRAMVDGGSKTFSGDRWMSGAKTGFGRIVEQPEVEFSGMSEEHGHLDLGQSGYHPRVGDRLSIIPNHVCACVNMHNEIYYHRGGEVQGSWLVAARGKVR